MITTRRTGLADTAAHARHRPARRIRPWALLLAAACLGACAHTPEPDARHTQRSPLDSIRVVATPHANHDAVTALDIVFVRDAAANARIPDNAEAWFANKAQLALALGASIEVESRQIVPAMTIAAVELPRDHADAVAVYAFAAYPDAPARQRIDLGNYRHPTIILGRHGVHVAATVQGSASKLPASRDPVDAARLRQAEQWIDSGDAARAIHGPISQVLAHYPMQPREGGHCYFSVTTSVEEGMYQLPLALCSKNGMNPMMLSGDWVRALILEGRAYNVLKQHDAALRVLQEAKQLAPDNPHVLFELGATHAMQGHWVQAQQCYSEAVGTANLLDDKDAVALELRATRGWGHALQQRGELDAAEVVYRRALTLSPGDAQSIKALQDIDCLRKLDGKPR